MDQNKPEAWGIDFSAFSLGISSQRWSAYLTGSTPDRAYRLYQWNIRLCEALYPLLHCLEIALRNALHREISAHTDNERWFEECWLSPPA